ncbi:hypothetical protein DBR18_04545 [Pseudomonas sp. HMWF021]|nr:hypothetical protein DBR18_04545 [Pseudomonas sp. HMWF021]
MEGSRTMYGNRVVASLETAAFPVGVSLLAMTDYQTTSMLNGLTPSRAGSLLQVVCLLGQA